MLCLLAVSTFCVHLLSVVMSGFCLFLYRLEINIKWKPKFNIFYLASVGWEVLLVYVGRHQVYFHMSVFRPCEIVDLFILYLISWEKLSFVLVHWANLLLEKAVEVTHHVWVELTLILQFDLWYIFLEPVTIFITYGTQIC